MGKIVENPYRCSKIPLHKNFKLVLEQNVRNQTYPKLSCRSQVRTSGIPNLTKTLNNFHYNSKRNKVVQLGKILDLTIMLMLLRDFQALKSG